MQRRDFLKASSVVPALPWTWRHSIPAEEGRRFKVGFVGDRKLMPLLAGEIRIERPDPDAVLRWGGYDEIRQAFRLLFTSKNWEPVPEGQECPCIELTFIDTHTGLPI